MPDLPSTLALLGLLLLARGFFALGEFAVRGAHKGQLQKLADAGDARARQALATAGAPAPALAATRGCVTLTTLLLGALTGRPLVDALAGAWGDAAGGLGGRGPGAHHRRRGRRRGRPPPATTAAMVSTRTTAAQGAARVAQAPARASTTAGR